MLRALFLVGLTSSLVACAPRVGIVRYRPAAVNLGSARALSVSVTARETGLAESALDLVGIVTGGSRIEPALLDEPLRAALSQQLAQDRHFEVTAPQAAQAELQVLITDYTQRIDEEKDSKGKVHASLMGTGTVTVSVRRGTAQPSVREFIEREKLQDDTSASRTPELVRWVAQSLATQIAFLITPRRYQDTIVLDDSSEAVKPALGLIVEDKLDEAQAALLALLERTPDDAAAHYNLGVLAELREALPAARERYVRAVQLSPTSLRQEAVERVDRVEAEQRALE